MSTKSFYDQINWVYFSFLWLKLSKMYNVQKWPAAFSSSAFLALAVLDGFGVIRVLMLRSQYYIYMWHTGESSVWTNSLKKSLFQLPLHTCMYKIHIFFVCIGSLCLVNQFCLRNMHGKSFQLQHVIISAYLTCMFTVNYTKKDSDNVWIGVMKKFYYAIHLFNLLFKKQNYCKRFLSWISLEMLPQRYQINVKLDLYEEILSASHQTAGSTQW